MYLRGVANEVVNNSKRLKLICDADRRKINDLPELADTLVRANYLMNLADDNGETLVWGMMLASLEATAAVEVDQLRQRINRNSPGFFEQAGKIVDEKTSVVACLVQPLQQMEETARYFLGFGKIDQSLALESTPLTIDYCRERLKTLLCLDCLTQTPVTAEATAMVEAIVEKNFFLGADLLIYLMSRVQSKNDDFGLLNQLAVAIDAVSRAEAPMPNVKLENSLLHRQRAWLSRALVLARDRLMSLWAPEAYALTGQTLGTLSGFNDYGFLFYFTQYRNYFGEIHPALREWLAGYTADALSKRIRSGFLTEFSVPKGIYGALEKVLSMGMGLDNSLADRIEKAGQRIFPEKWNDYRRGDSYFKQVRMLAIGLSRLLDAQSKSRVGKEESKEIDEIRNEIRLKLLDLPDLARSRVVAGEVQLRQIVEVLREHRIPATVYLAVFDHRGRRTSDYRLTVEQSLAICRGECPSGLDLAAAEIRRRYESAFGSCDDLNSQGIAGILGGWSLARIGNERGFSMIVLEKAIYDLGLGELGLEVRWPVEVQLGVGIVKGQDVARRNWEAKALHHRARVSVSNETVG